MTAPDLVGAPVLTAPVRWLSSPHPQLHTQAAWSAARDRVLIRSGASGIRAIQALHVILLRHAPVPLHSASGAQLTCGDCRPDAATYPCPTASTAYDALDALLF